MKKKWIQRTAALLLCAAMLAAGSGQSVPEAEAKAASKTTGAYDKEATGLVMVFGRMAEQKADRITLDHPNKQNPYPSIILNITEDTLILDAASLTPVKAEDIDYGETLYAYTSRVMTRSMPPISNARVILCNIPYNFIMPSFQEIMEGAKTRPVNVLQWGSLGKDETGRYLLTCTDDRLPNKEIVLNITEDTLVLDAVKGLPVDLKDLKANETVYVYTDLAMTLSLPPITNAQLILCGIPADYKVPSYYEITKVIKEDGVTFLSTDKGDTLKVNADCELSPYLTKNIVTRDDLKTGGRILVWADTSDQPQRILIFSR
ncbi:hypothetical protein [Anaerolentibacter hominis]|uniref:hypothetical protein n=1 Tax=Anaerolentibacter hominis TaxID=3079009 RepID=UPI0031B80C55